MTDRYLEPATTLPPSSLLQLLNTSPTHGLSTNAVAALTADRPPSPPPTPSDNPSPATPTLSASDLPLAVTAALVFAVWWSTRIPSARHTESIVFIVILSLSLAFRLFALFSYVRSRAARASLEDGSADTRIVELIRDANPAFVAAATVVPGDVFALRAGNTVVVRARVIVADGLRVDASARTGGVSSTPVDASPSPDSIVYPGDLVVAGSGLAVAFQYGPLPPSDAAAPSAGALPAQLRNRYSLIARIRVSQLVHFGTAALAGLLLVVFLLLAKISFTTVLGGGAAICAALSVSSYGMAVFAAFSGLMPKLVANGVLVRSITSCGLLFRLAHLVVPLDYFVRETAPRLRAVYDCSAIAAADIRVRARSSSDSSDASIVSLVGISADDAYWLPPAPDATSANQPFTPEIAAVVALAATNPDATLTRTRVVPVGEPDNTVSLVVFETSQSAAAGPSSAAARPVELGCAIVGPPSAVAVLTDVGIPSPVPARASHAVVVGTFFALWPNGGDDAVAQRSEAIGKSAPPSYDAVVESGSGAIPTAAVPLASLSGADIIVRAGASLRLAVLCEAGTQHDTGAVANVLALGRDTGIHVTLTTPATGPRLRHIAATLGLDDTDFVIGSELVTARVDPNDAPATLVSLSSPETTDLIVARLQDGGAVVGLVSEQHHRHGADILAVRGTTGTERAKGASDVLILNTSVAPILTTATSIRLTMLLVVVAAVAVTIHGVAIPLVPWMLAPGSAHTLYPFHTFAATVSAMSFFAASLRVAARSEYPNTHIPRNALPPTHIRPLIYPQHHVFAFAVGTAVAALPYIAWYDDLSSARYLVMSAALAFGHALASMMNWTGPSPFTGRVIGTADYVNVVLGTAFAIVPATNSSLGGDPSTTTLLIGLASFGAGAVGGALVWRTVFRRAAAAAA